MVSLVGFVAAAAGLWFGLGDRWRAIAVGSAVVSTTGIVTFFGAWPTSNAIAVLGVNVVVLVAVLVLHSPAQTL